MLVVLELNFGLLSLVLVKVSRAKDDQSVIRYIHAVAVGILQLAD